MAGIMFRGLLQGTVGGGGGVVGGATPWDDEFNYGTVLDTTGARFTGAKPWTKFGTGVNFTSDDIISGEWRVGTSSNGLPYYPHGASEGTLPAGDWEFTTDCYQAFGDREELIGLYLAESSTGKDLIIGVGQDYSGSGGTLDKAFRVSSSSARYVRDTSITFGTQYDAQVRVARVGSNLTYSWSTNSGVSWTAALTHAQTTPFTTAPDRVGVMKNHSVPTPGAPYGYFRWFRKTA